MAQQIFVSSSKLSTPVMTSESRVTQKQGGAAYSRSEKYGVPVHIFAFYAKKITVDFVDIFYAIERNFAFFF